MKIDTSTIQGYAEMTPEQKIAYFEGYEFNDNASELAKLQEAIKKSNENSLFFNNVYLWFSMNKLHLL